MKVTEDRLAVARAVLEKNGSWLLPDEIRAVIAAIPEPESLTLDEKMSRDQNREIYSEPLPAPPGVGVCCMCDAKIPVACKDCLDYARESVGLPAPDVAIPICPPGRGPQELPAPTAKGGAE